MFYKEPEGKYFKNIKTILSLSGYEKDGLWEGFGPGLLMSTLDPLSPQL